MGADVVDLKMLLKETAYSKSVALWSVEMRSVKHIFPCRSAPPITILVLPISTAKIILSESFHQALDDSLPLLPISFALLSPIDTARVRTVETTASTTAFIPTNAATNARTFSSPLMLMM